jgi:hypothetical protein
VEGVSALLRKYCRKWFINDNFKGGCRVGSSKDWSANDESFLLIIPGVSESFSRKEIVLMIVSWVQNQGGIMFSPKFDSQDAFHFPNLLVSGSGFPRLILIHNLGFSLILV